MRSFPELSRLGAARYKALDVSFQERRNLGTALVRQSSGSETVENRFPACGNHRNVAPVVSFNSASGPRRWLARRVNLTAS